jgi:hypothetical protein
MAMLNEPRYPIYIVSKGRWESRLTSKALELMRVPYHIVVEPQEYGHYAAVIDPAKILTLPFTNLGRGSVPARNWVWEYSINREHARHWILDDNIQYFLRFHRNRRYRMRSGATFRAAEDFVDRYENVAMAGMQYEKFVPVKEKHSKPFVTNTRIYSCILLDNCISYRWRGRYNEDTDLSLRVLKGGYCTILFYAFLAEKRATMTMRGGNTDELYQGDGRLEMARSLRRQHPDVVKVVRKWGRWQHQVDYRPFRGNKLIRKPGLVLPAEPNEYGMRLLRVEDQTSNGSESVRPDSSVRESR